MHRFIPILAKQAGFRRIGEKVVEHHARKYGCSKFGLERTVKGYLDLITVLFMTHFGRSPMYFFGSLGTLMFLIGGGTTVWIIAAKIWKQVHGLSLRPVTDQRSFTWRSSRDPRRAVVPGGVPGRAHQPGFVGQE